MNIHNFAKWQRLQGNQILRSESSFWLEAGPRVFQAFPFNWLIQPSERELRMLMIKHGILALRYSTNVDALIGMISYHVVLKNPYNQETLGKRARYWVRQGLSHCQVEQISLKRLADEGWKLQQDTLDRQGRVSAMSESEWRRICLSAEGLEGFEAWGAIVENELAAAILTARIDDTAFVPYALSHRKFLDLHVNQALFYTASCNLLSREEIKGIFFTVQSLDAPSSVDEFKFRMGFEARPVRQRVLFHPLLEPFMNKSTHKLLARLFLRYPKNKFLPKAEGMLRFYLRGTLPLEKQEWPDCLAQSGQKLSDNPVLGQTA
jgi:hypothetical protein